MNHQLSTHVTALTQHLNNDLKKHIYIFQMGGGWIVKNVLKICSKLLKSTVSCLKHCRYFAEGVFWYAALHERSFALCDIMQYAM